MVTEPLSKYCQLRTRTLSAVSCQTGTRQLCLAVLIVGLFYAVGPAAAQSGALAQSFDKTNRLALIIGNSAYKTNVLMNPRNDAALMTTTLQKVGFKVRSLIDADRNAMQEAILAFGRDLRSAGSDSVGLFYYAGHGVQVDGENYLIPLLADIKDQTEIPLAGVSLNKLMETMHSAGGRLNISILDACRDNPFPATVRGGSRGLAAVRAPTGSFIAYATGPGDVAYDGDTRNSPYTRALADAIPTAGATIEEVFRRTRRQVLKVTRGRQTPWEHSSLTGKFFFVPDRITPEESRSEETELLALGKNRANEIADWDKIKSTGDADALRHHIETYPNGLFAELASLKLAQLTADSDTPWSWVITGAVNELPPAGEADRIYEHAVQLESSARTMTELTDAIALYREAAAMEQVPAMYRLARAYDHGLGVTRDLDQAFKWYRRAADKGHVSAMASLGTMYEYGEGTSASLAEALSLYRQAAERGDPRGMASLAFLYQQGKGVAKNERKARRWYGTAAERGLPRAMFNLGLMLAHGEGGKRDTREAIRLFKAAAENGHSGAMRELAFRFDEGRGVARNSRLAADYLYMAIAAGSQRALQDALSPILSWNFSTRRKLQKKLAADGLYDGVPHGFLDRQTKSALMQLAELKKNGK